MLNMHWVKSLKSDLNTSKYSPNSLAKNHIYNGSVTNSFCLWSRDEEHRLHGLDEWTDRPNQSLMSSTLHQRLVWVLNPGLQPCREGYTVVRLDLRLPYNREEDW